MAKDNDWTQNELDASVEVYLKMLSKEKSGTSYKKSEYRNQLLGGALNKRSDSAFEYRMRNISSVLDSLGYQYIKGYKPAKNVGTHTKNSILNSLERSNFFDPSDFEPTSDAEQLQERTEKIRKRINLNNKPTGQRRAKRTTAFAKVFLRDPAIRAWILENANGKCEACDMEAPFLLSDGHPFLEVHHMIPLALDGPDTIENAIALCPNCHRRSHLSIDKNSFNDGIYKKVLRLVK